MDRLVWAASSTYRIGSFYLGIRSNRVEVDDMLRSALGAYLVDGMEAPPNFSVIIASGGSDGDVATGLHFLYRNHTSLVRSRRPGRVVEALFTYLSSYQRPPSDALLRVAGVALVKDGRAVLVPARVNNSATIAPRLHRGGIQFVDVPRVAIDVQTAEVVVEGPDLAVDWRALGALEGSGSAGSEPPAVGPGRYPLVAWALSTDGDDPTDTISMAKAVVAVAAPLLQESGTEAKEVIESFVRLFSKARPIALGSHQQEDLASKLQGLFTA